MNLLCLSDLLVGMGCTAGCRDSALAVCLCLDSGQDETFMQFQQFSQALINVFSKSCWITGFTHLLVFIISLCLIFKEIHYGVN